MPSNIDLHLHSTASDGTDTPAELIRTLQAAKIHTFSLTDHDAITGCKEILPLIPEGMTFYTGVEFSCITDEGKCHILGYDYDLSAPSIAWALEAGRALRMAKLDRRLDYLLDICGITFPEDTLTWLHSLNSPGKPHLANLIVAQGQAPDRNTAIKEYIDPCPGGDDRIPAETAITGILGGGGVPIWAHPLGGEWERHLTPPEFAVQLKCLLSFGLQGIECHYSRYTEDEVRFLVQQAETYQLLISGGSDYHGASKDIPLGQLNVENHPIPAETLTLLAYLKQRRG